METVYAVLANMYMIKRYTDKKELAIETLSGIKYLTLKTENNKVKEVTVDMGKCIVYEPTVLHISYGDVKVIPVNMGNPHAVTLLKRQRKLHF